MNDNIIFCAENVHDLKMDRAHIRFCQQGRTEMLQVYFDRDHRVIISPMDEFSLKIEIVPL